MSNRTTVVVFALAATLAAPIALADYVDTAEGGFAPHIPENAETAHQKLPSVATREDVRRDAEMANRTGTLPLERESEEAFQQHQGFGGLTREEVRTELQDWERNPVTRDGYREVGGETGWVYLRD